MRTAEQSHASGIGLPANLLVFLGTLLTFQVQSSSSECLTMLRCSWILAFQFPEVLKTEAVYGSSLFSHTVRFECSTLSEAQVGYHTTVA